LTLKNAKKRAKKSIPNKILLSGDAF